MTDSPSASERLAHARHELRTPLGAMIGYSEMILEDEGDLAPNLVSELKAFLEKSRTLLERVQDLLNANRLVDLAGDLPGLGAAAGTQLEPDAEDMLRRSGQLRASGEGSEAGRDLERIGAACGLFRGMLDSELSFDPGAKKPDMSVAAAVPAASVAVGGARTAGEEVEAADIPWESFAGHVLVVDDVAFNREILARGLWRQRRHFALAANGRQALAMLEEGSFDLVLLDLMMPEMDGFEVLARLKADKRLGHIPVIMISALDQMDGIVRCIQMGAEDYLPKPFDPVLLEARVSACLEKKRLRDLELEYLRNVNKVTEAAAAVETGEFDPARIEEVALRKDSLGQLARVFQSMAREVLAREDRLKQEVQQLKVEIDEVRKVKQVEEITESDYFQHLQERAETLRRRPKK